MATCMNVFGMDNMGADFCVGTDLTSRMRHLLPWLSFQVQVEKTESRLSNFNTGNTECVMR